MMMKEKTMTMMMMMVMMMMMLRCPSMQATPRHLPYTLCIYTYNIYIYNYLFKFIYSNAHHFVAPMRLAKLQVRSTGLAFSVAAREPGLAWQSPTGESGEWASTNMNGEKHAKMEPMKMDEDV